MENTMTEENKTSQGGGSTQGGAGQSSSAIPAEAAGKLESSRAHVKQAAGDLKSAAGAVAEEYRGKAEQAWGDARERVRTFQEDSEEYVRENPTKAVVAALGLGFVLGLIFRK